MSAWPTTGDVPLVTITPMSLEGCLGATTFNDANAALNGFTSASWPTTNLAVFLPFSVAVPTQFSTLFTMNGATASGNTDIGIYTMDGTKLVSSGSVAQSGTNNLQLFTVTSTLLSPGMYYIAVSKDGTTGTFFRGQTGQVMRTRITGAAQMASAFPLPSTATFASIGQDAIPLIGLSTRSTI